jgi:hypothetical protein
VYHDPWALCVPPTRLYIDPFFDPDVNPIEKTIEHGGVAPIKLVYVLAALMEME